MVIKIRHDIRDNIFFKINLELSYKRPCVPIKNLRHLSETKHPLYVPTGIRIKSEASRSFLGLKNILKIPGLEPRTSRLACYCAITALHAQSKIKRGIFDFYLQFLSSSL